MLVSILFKISVATAIFSSAMVVVAKNPIRAVFALILTFIATSVCWLLLEVEFLAWTLILVYVGAVMVLFIFVVMMLDVEKTTQNSKFIKYLPLGICAPILLAIILIYGLGPHDFGINKVIPPEQYPADYSNVIALGNLLFTDYLIHLEIAACILLAALVAAIVINKKNKKTLNQKIENQIKVNKKQRLKLIDMVSETKFKRKGKV